MPTQGWLRIRYIDTNLPLVLILARHLEWLEMDSWRDPSLFPAGQARLFKINETVNHVHCQ